METKKTIITFMISLWTMMPLYVALHEGGHGVVAKLCGAKIIDFNIVEAYVEVESTNFNTQTLALFYLAGVLLPTIICGIVLLSYKKNRENLFYQMATKFYIGIALFSVGVWIVVPLLYSIGIVNPIDDVTYFIESTRISPILVMLGASLVFGIYIYIAWKKKLFEIRREYTKE